MPVVLLLAIAWGVSGCGDGRQAEQAPPGPAHEAQAGDTLRLSGERPRAVLPVAAAPLIDANVLSLTVSEVSNPDRRAIDVHVALQADDGTGEPVPIGSVALFPVDQGGTFTLRIPAPARELIARRHAGGAGLELVVTLGPDPGPGPGPDRRALLVTGWRWTRTSDG